MGCIRAGAGEGNRTLVISLEGFCSTIELHPPSSFTKFLHPCRRGALPFPELTGGGGWIRTNVGARPTDLQSAPFSRSGTPPAEPEIMWFFRWLVKNFRSQVVYQILSLHFIGKSLEKIAPMVDPDI